MEARFGVVIVAGGESARFAGKEKKPYADLLGRAVWLHSLDLFARRPDVAEVVLVIAEADAEMFDLRFRSTFLLMPHARTTLGGASRRESVARGLAALGPEPTHVCVHDAARPCLTAALVDAVFAQAAATGAAILARPVTETVKRVAADAITATVPRDGLWLAETPQVFRRDWLAAAHALPADAPATDDAALVEALGHPVAVVPSGSANLKLTYAEDLALAAAVLTARRPLAELPSRPAFDEDAAW